MKKPQLAARLGGLAGIVALVALVAALAPAAASASTKACPNKSIKVKSDPPSHISVPVKAISTQGGVSCAKAYSVISGVISGKPPAGWKSVPAHFVAPEGLVPQEVKKGSKKIKFAVQGG